MMPRWNAGLPCQFGLVLTLVLEEWQLLGQRRLATANHCAQVAMMHYQELFCNVCNGNFRAPPETASILTVL